MTRGLKLFAPLLATVLTIAALPPSAALAKQGEFTAAKYEASIEGTPVEEKANALTVAGYSIKCKESGFGGRLLGAATTLTLTPTYNGCYTEGFEFSNVTVTENGCAYKINVGIGMFDKWPSTVDVECPAGKKFVVHVYFDAAHEIELCTIEIPEQKGLAGPALINLTGAGKLEMEGEFSGLKYEQSGNVCETAEPKNGVRHITAQLSGRHEGEADKLVID